MTGAYPQLATLAGVPQYQAERQPATCVFRCRGETLDYAGLHAHSQALASALIDLGVAPGDRVGIYANKSIHLPVSVFGIMNAGAAYVPLDANAPPARIERLIRDCGISVLIADDYRLRVLPELAPALRGVIGVSRDPELGCPVLPWEALSDWEGKTVAVHPKADDLAYIIYTSGSTGEPKGIMHTHASGMAYARAAARLYALSPRDRLSNFPPLHFDQSTFDFFCGPLAGACTVLIPEDVMSLPAELTRLVETEQLTVWYSVPYALVQMLLRGNIDKRDLRALRWVLFGGEPFPPHYLRQLMSHMPNAVFSNVYGPAEVNQCSYFNLCTPADAERDQIPLGRMWDAAQALVVDEQDEPVVREGSGELLVASATMMSGYWQRPDLDARVFCTRSDAHGSRRYYRTGDLVRRGADGLLYFTGRKDRMVKSRGFRIELDEVEAALATHPGVAHVGVFTTPNQEGSVDIAAAVMLKPDMDVAESALRAHAARTLPRYAVPATIRIMSSLPRTSTGKVDRKTLALQFSR